MQSSLKEEYAKDMVRLGCTVSVSKQYIQFTNVRKTYSVDPIIDEQRAIKLLSLALPDIKAFIESKLPSSESTQASTPNGPAA